MFAVAVHVDAPCTLRMLASEERADSFRNDQLKKAVKEMFSKNFCREARTDFFLAWHKHCCPLWKTKHAAIEAVRSVVLAGTDVVSQAELESGIRSVEDSTFEYKAIMYSVAGVVVMSDANAVLLTAVRSERCLQEGKTIRLGKPPDGPRFEVENGILVTPLV